MILWFCEANLMMYEQEHLIGVGIRCGICYVVSNVLRIQADNLIGSALLSAGVLICGGVLLNRNVAVFTCGIVVMVAVCRDINILFWK